MPDNTEYVTLDCGCVVEIDCYDNWQRGYGGEEYKASDSLGGGRITKPCTTHIAAAIKEN